MYVYTHISIYMNLLYSKTLHDVIYCTLCGSPIGIPPKLISELLPRRICGSRSGRAGRSGADPEGQSASAKGLDVSYNNKGVCMCVCVCARICISMCRH